MTTLIRQVILLALVMASGMVMLVVTAGCQSSEGNALSPAAIVTPSDVTPVIPTGPNSSAITATFNGTPIKAGNYIWFNSIVKSTKTNDGQGIDLTNVLITFTVNGAPITIPVPDAMIRWVAGATASTTFNADLRKWVTIVPAGYSGEIFLTGFGYRVPYDFPGGIKDVTWSANFCGYSSEMQLQWKWAAAVYTSFSTTPCGIQVKPVEGSSLSIYANADHAGTPENYKKSVIGGARGGGGSNYTGSYSGTKSVTPCVK